MRVTEHWLQEWVKYTLDPQTLAQRLTMLGLEVEEVSSAAGTFEGVIVAHVLETRPHPEADKLTLCQVDTGTGEPLQIVCGADNVRANLKVALAQVEAVLPNGFKIKEAKLRGERSLGMLCSMQELGMAESSQGILELDEDAPIGVSLRTYLDLDDHVFDIDLTPNRADCLSIQGIAREIATQNNLSLTPPKMLRVQPVMDEQCSVTVDAVEACPLYTGRLIRGINPQAVTPLWMRERLRRMGITPIHPVVDVTQYVMLELGQPMHAFDASQIHNNIRVRLSKPGESLVLLNGQNLTFKDPVLLIADDKGPLAMAGIMGGEESAVHEGTVDIFLESAFFAPQSVARVARKYGLMTDASFRYERGVDPLLPPQAMERATQLLQEIVGGQPGPVVVIQQTADWFSERVVQFRPTQVFKRIGIQVDLARMQSILTALGFTIAEHKADVWTLTVPSYRFDIQIEEDIIEEIVRMVGYDQVPALSTTTCLQEAKISWIDRTERLVGEALTALGYRETISYSFIDPAVRELLFPTAKALSLANPLSSELSEMRVSLWPGLLASMLHNLHRSQDSIALYECGRAFELSDGGLQETLKVAALLTGTASALDWTSKPHDFDFYDVKGDLEAFFKRLAVPVQFEAQAHSALHPGKSSCLRLADKIIGYCGVLHPQIAELLGISTEVLLFECDLEALSMPARTVYASISKYQQIRRDLAFLVDKTVEYAQIEAIVHSVRDEGILKSFHVFDIYAGSGIEAGKQSLALAFYLQSDKGTLIDSEINAYLDAIVKKLESTLAMSLRDGT